MDEKLRSVSRFLDGEKNAALCREFEVTTAVLGSCTLATGPGVRLGMLMPTRGLSVLRRPKSIKASPKASLSA